MLTVTPPLELDGEGLREELAAVDIQVGRDEVSFVEVWEEGVFIGNELIFETLDESDREAVEAVIAAHTGQPTSVRINEQLIKESAAEAMAELQQIIDFAGTPTVQNLSNAIKTVARTLRGVIRLELKLYDDHE